MPAGKQADEHLSQDLRLPDDDALQLGAQALGQVRGVIERQAARVRLKRLWGRVHDDVEASGR